MLAMLLALLALVIYCARVCPVTSTVNVHAYLQTHTESNTCFVNPSLLPSLVLLIQWVILGWQWISVSSDSADIVWSFSPCSCRAAPRCVQTYGYKEAGCLQPESGAFGHVQCSVHNLHILNGQFLTLSQWGSESCLIVPFSGHWHVPLSHFVNVL